MSANLYTFFDKSKKNIGKHNNVPDSFFDKKQLELGINIELEHVEDKETAKKIAKDHLSEFPDYYTQLIKMERSAENKKKKSERKNKSLTINQNVQESDFPYVDCRIELERLKDIVKKNFRS